MNYPSQIIRIDGVATEIRPMAHDYVIGEDPVAAGIEYAIKCWPGKNVPGQWPNAPIAAYFKKIMDAYGSAAITAWQDKKLVGFLPFMPLNCGMPEMAFCVCAPYAMQTPLAEIAAATPVPFSRLSPKVLKVQCASVNARLYRKGLGETMARYLAIWARENGWENIEGKAFSDPTFRDAYKWIPSIQFWEKSGFSRLRNRQEDMGELGSSVPVSDFTLNLK